MQLADTAERYILWLLVFARGWNGTFAGGKDCRQCNKASPSPAHSHGLFANSPQKIDSMYHYQGTLMPYTASITQYLAVVHLVRALHVVDNG